MSDASAARETSLFHLCNYCGTPAASGEHLKRCSGCFAGPVYCGAPCQRADWLTHKTAFHGFGQDSNFYKTVMEPSAQMVGYDSVHALSRGLYEYREAHKWTMAALIKAYTLQHFGVQFSANFPSDKLLLLELVSLGPDKNPAEGFRLVSAHWKTTEDWIKATNIPVDLRTQVSETFERAKKTTHSHYAAGARYAGVLPVCYTIHDFPTVFWRMVPQYAPSSLRAAPTELPWVQQLLHSMVIFGFWCINHQVVLRPPLTAEAMSAPALPGYLVRVRGDWTWRPFFTQWIEFYNDGSQCPELSQVLRGTTITGGHPPTFLMDILDAYW